MTHGAAHEGKKSCGWAQLWEKENEATRLFFKEKEGNKEKVPGLTPRRSTGGDLPAHLKPGRAISESLTSRDETAITSRSRGKKRGKGKWLGLKGCCKNCLAGKMRKKANLQRSKSSLEFEKGKGLCLRS